MTNLDQNIDLPDGENLIPAAEKVKAMHAVLGDGPFHLGRPSSDREAWDPWAEQSVGRFWVAEEKRLVEAGVPRVTNELLALSQEEDSRAAYNEVFGPGRRWLTAMVLAECFKPEGRFIEAIVDEITHLATLATWVHPAHDSDGKNFKGRTIEVDLGSAQTALFLTSVDFLLGDRLPAATRALIRSEVDRRIFVPFRERVESGKDVYWWVTCDHNWNTVCVNCVLGCALWLKEERAERAWYLALADDLIEYSNRGFSPSGFYTEGLSYWSYGFGNYIALSELVRGATCGRIDWLKESHQNRMARYGLRMELQDDLYPTFADSHLDWQPLVWVTHWLNNRRDEQRDPVRTTTVPIDPFEDPVRQTVTSTLLNLFYTVEGEAYRMDYPLGPREWFEDVQFLICRPAEGSGSRLAASFIGGHNGVNHNHNDLGSFSVAMDGRYLICDPGYEIYTNRTFSSDRYLGRLLNSFGHPVPVVAGALQAPGPGEHRPGYGSDFRSVVLGTEFSESEDRVVLDLSRAYRVDTLKRLERTFRYIRSEIGAMEVTDEVVYARPELFETALITFADWHPAPDGSVIIGDADGAIRVTVETDAGALDFAHEVIRESSTPTRLSWRLTQPVAQATVRLVIRPESIVGA